MGGNVNIDGEVADKIDLNIIDRSTLCYDLNELAEAFHVRYGCKPAPSGSTVFLFNEGIPLEDLLRDKPIFGDIDFQVDKKIKFFLEEIESIGPFRLIGWKKTTNTTVSLWSYRGHKIQIDFEAVEFGDDGNPTEWSKFAYSASWFDALYGIKGVAHKYIFRALTAQWIGDYPIKMKTKTKVERTSLFAFSNRGLRRKLIPVDDGTFYELKPSESNYCTDLEDIFYILIGKLEPLTSFEKFNMWTFVGTVTMIERYINPSKWEAIADGMAHLMWGKGAQRIYSNDWEDQVCKQKIMMHVSTALNIDMRRWDEMINTYYGTVQDN